VRARVRVACELGAGPTGLPLGAGTGARPRKILSWQQVRLTGGRKPLRELQLASGMPRVDCNLVHTYGSRVRGSTYSNPVPATGLVNRRRKQLREPLRTLVAVSEFGATHGFVRHPSGVSAGYRGHPYPFPGRNPGAAMCLVDQLQVTKLGAPKALVVNGRLGQPPRSSHRLVGIGTGGWRLQPSLHLVRGGADEPRKRGSESLITLVVVSELGEGPRPLPWEEPGPA